MKSVILGMCCAIALSAGSAQAAQTTTNADRRLDARIEKRIHDDAMLKKFDIDVSVDRGVATLTGTVATEAERLKAGSLAKVSGISHVDNKLVVDRNAPLGIKGTAGKIGDKTREGAEKTMEGAKKVGEKSKETLSKTGEIITDGWITTRVKSKFIGEDLLKNSNIDVSTNDHVVTLSGTVMSEAGRARAIAEAKDVEGVHHVIDKLTIGPKR